MNTRTYMQSQSQTSAHSADATCQAAPAAQSVLSAGLSRRSEAKADEGAPTRVPEFKIQNSKFKIRNSSGIALVITLLMLSVITFLAVAFLVLTRTHRDSATATLDVETARSMSGAALARAQSEIIAHMMAHRDLFNYDYMVSHNAINPVGFVKGVADPTNVNYDYYSASGAAMAPTLNGGLDWAQNIANLWYDPRPPVFIRTNASLSFPADFRFWVDLNRNGKFETNGYLPYITENGQPFNNMGALLTNFYNGEPEWVGALQYPQYRHSATNHFIGRYAFLVLPIGKTLDFNYIHNYAKNLASGGDPVFMPSPAGGMVDKFIRDQGVGSWELNLAALLWNLNLNNYPLPASYNYVLTPNPNFGAAFDDAYSFVHFRYNANYGTPYPLSLAYFFGATTPSYAADSIDEYAIEPLLYPASPPANLVNAPWPGSYATNYFYNIQDIFNTSKTSPAFVNRLLLAGAYTNSYDRYTFQRLLASIGTGSAPELQTFVYGDVTTTNPAVQPPTVLRPKVNLNYDNSYQITNGLNTSPTVLVPWTQIGGALRFFTNAAESLLRSQNFRVTNYLVAGVPPNQVFVPTNISFIHFGLTNIPVYNSLNPSIRYTEQMHRMLQLAANIYDATRPNAVPLPGQPLPYPSVFRPLFFSTNYGHTNQVLYIVGYAQVTDDARNRVLNMLPPESGPNNGIGLKAPWENIGPNDNVWGIPWVVGAVKGLPAFDRYVSGTSWMITRKLLFTRKNPLKITTGNGVLWTGNPAATPANTNQFFLVSISNAFGVDGLNAYAANVTRQFQIIATNCVLIVLTNNSGSNPGGFTAVIGSWTNFTTNFWRGYGSAVNAAMTGGMLAALQTNPVPLPQSYFSGSTGAFLPVSSDFNIPNFNLGQLQTTNGAFQSADLSQTIWPVYNWTLTVTNYVMYALVDPASGYVFDFVNLGPFGTNLVLTNILTSATIPHYTQPGGGSGSSVPASSANYWDPTPVPGRPSQGVLNQITNGMNLDQYFAAELLGQTTALINGSNAIINSNLYFSCSNDVVATVFTGVTNTLLVNDPLVHYTVGDLTPPLADSSLILTKNSRYEPWPTTSYTNYYRANMTLKDPLIFQSDNWNFPTNKFPSVGWLGRVHRGTPWQTIFMKADVSPLVAPGLTLNEQTWINSWVSTLDTYPTNDYALLDLFTAAPNDNASRGLLSVNQTNSAPWYALLCGLLVNTNISYPPARPAYPTNLVLDPTTIAPLLDGYVVITNDSNGNPVTNFLAGINNVRALETDQTFHNLGRVFQAPMLSISSPFLPGPAGAFTDEEIEAIPQQVAGLLKVGQPQFVIYGFGQALKPKDIYFGSQASLFNLCTNYQITGEFLTRTVCHVVGDPTAANVKIQVDSFNIIPAD
jgi:hypothetical protein